MSAGLQRACDTDCREGVLLSAARGYTCGEPTLRTGKEVDHKLVVQEMPQEPVVLPVLRKATWMVAGAKEASKVLARCLAHMCALAACTSRKVSSQVSQPNAAGCTEAG